MTVDAAARSDGITWHVHAHVDKWTPEQVAQYERETGIAAPSGDMLAAHFAPDEVAEAAGNLLTTAGLTRLVSLLAAAGGQGATNTATRLGVGDSNTAAAIGDTDLGASAGSTHRYFQPMDATYPSVSGAVLTAKATFGGSDGNFHWQEWGLDIGTPTVSGGTTVNATLLNHKIADLGTKVSGAIWALTVTITLS